MFAVRAASRLAAIRPQVPVRSMAGRPTSGRGSKPDAQLTFKEAWLADPATYPIIVIISTACIGCAAYCAKCLFGSPDVRITKTSRSQIIRDWS
mmetsp:Transcript_33667/g.104262  ORF Transcript_33667/g.104262 Transcript_33667/m.104262 type:complete len:94 (-) Transcript_33667:47-328(-)